MKRSKSSRHHDILAEITRSPSLRVAELAARLGVSTETIRRDLDDLNARELVQRTYGGAVRARDTEPSIGARQGLFVTERERIARAVSARMRLRPGGLVMIGSGATTAHVASRIAADHNDITVITHSFGVATVMASNPTITTLVAPGTYLAGECATVGAHTLRFLSDFSADLAIVGASGLTGEGLTDALIEPAAVYGAMVARAAETMVVADHSKFDRVLLARYATWRDVRILVTDRSPADALAKALSRNKVEVLVA